MVKLAMTHVLIASPTTFHVTALKIKNNFHEHYKNLVYSPDAKNCCEATWEIFNIIHLHYIYAVTYIFINY